MCVLFHGKKSPENDLSSNYVFNEPCLLMYHIMKFVVWGYDIHTIFVFVVYYE